MVGEIHVCSHRAVGDLSRMAAGVRVSAGVLPSIRWARRLFSTQREGRQSYVRVSFLGWVCAFPGFAKKPLALPRLLSDLLLL